MASSLSFILVVTSITCLLLLPDIHTCSYQYSSIACLLLAIKHGYAYSISKENKDFEIHASNVTDGDLALSVVVAGGNSITYTNLIVNA